MGWIYTVKTLPSFGEFWYAADTHNFKHNISLCRAYIQKHKSIMVIHFLKQSTFDQVLLEYGTISRVKLMYIHVFNHISVDW